MMKNPVVALAVVVLAAFSMVMTRGIEKKVPAQKDQPFFSEQVAAASYENIVVERAVDGDTLKLANGQRVRMIGIDTPEVHESAKLYRDSQRSGMDAKTIQQMGKKSMAFTKDLVEGKSVRLEFDVERQDKYGRLLAYVYLADGTMVNAQIIQQGYASLMTIPPNVKHADEFLQLYQNARKQKKGLWK
jgi:micrococcal nuclease